VVDLARRRGPVRVSVVRWLIAAGIGVVAIGSALRWVSSSADPIPMAVTPVDSARAVPVAFENAGYDAAVAELERTLADRRGQLDSATVRILEESLALIDRAIAEARAAIQRDTANAYLNEHIAGNLRKKLNVLRLATRAIASET
jgi:hypothetical protein